MTGETKAALVAVALAVLLNLRDARVAQTLRAQSAHAAAAKFAEHPDHLFEADGAGDEDADDDFGFGTDDFGSDAAAAKPARSASASAANADGAFDEFNFASDYDDGEAEDDDDDDDAYGGSVGEHRLLIQFDDVQYKAQFDAVRVALERNYPQLRGNVRGEKYPVPALTQTISSAMSWAPMLLLALGLVGGRLFAALGLPPAMLEKIQANRMYILPVFLLFNSFVKPQISKTNAFEVVYNGALVFSKLRTGVLPVDQDLPQLVAALAAAGLKARNAFT